MFLCVKDGNIFFQRLIFRDDINDLPAGIDTETKRCCELQESDNYLRHAWLPAKMRESESTNWNFRKIKDLVNKLEKQSSVAKYEY